jgi:hypothetical protein
VKQVWKWYEFRFETQSDKMLLGNFLTIGVWSGRTFHRLGRIEVCCLRWTPAVFSLTAIGMSDEERKEIGQIDHVHVRVTTGIADGNYIFLYEIVPPYRRRNSV